MMELTLSNTSNGASVRSTFPRNPKRKAPLVFLLLIVGVLAVASAAAVIVDVKTDGYQYRADQESLRFS